jgi:hypothetical protein
MLSDPIDDLIDIRISLQRLRDRTNDLVGHRLNRHLPKAQTEIIDPLDTAIASVARFVIDLVEET